MSTQTATGGLSAIAASMKAKAAHSPNRHAYQRLERGLHIVYGVRDGQYRLAIGRLAPTWPSYDEMQIIADAFQAPFDFVPSHREARWWDEVDHRYRIYKVLEITWFQTSAEDSAVAGFKVNSSTTPVEA